MSQRNTILSQENSSLKSLVNSYLEQNNKLQNSLDDISSRYDVLSRKHVDLEGKSRTAVCY